MTFPPPLRMNVVYCAAAAAVALTGMFVEESKLKYPSPPQQEQNDDYHGTRIADPYRKLEEPDAAETRTWVEAENKLTAEFLQAVPARKALRERLTALWNYERYGAPTVAGGRYFFTRNDGLQNHAVLYTADGADAEPRVLLDPNKLSDDGTVSLVGYEPSRDGRLLAYSLSSGGSDWQEWRVRDAATGVDTDDVIRWVKFSGVSWSADDAGFYYSRYDEPTAGTELTGSLYYQKLYYHRLGTPQSDDRLTYERPDEKDWGIRGGVTDDGRYLAIAVERGTEPKTRFFYQDLSTTDAPVTPVIDAFEAEYALLGNDGPTFYFTTDAAAPRKRIVAIDVRDPRQVQEIVPEQPQVLDGAALFGDRFYCLYLNDVKHEVRTFGLDGRPGPTLPLPGIGSVSGFGGRRDDAETFFTFTGFTAPTTVYRLDLKTGESTVYRMPKVTFDPNEFVTEQVFYGSRDGTRIPMFVIRKRGLPRDGARPTLLYGYGGFNISLTPGFSPGRIAWLERGGVLAIPNLRGGGEYGREWHEAGMLDRKQNVFDDFIAAAEHLIAQKYTRSDKLAIHGRSNGGLLAGACLTQRPELFGAALPDVGVLDMLRFHKFTIGWAWVNEYGSSDDAAQFRKLLQYSPLHNLKPGTHYPATLISTADHDDRVVPAHSYKFAAALQAAQGGPAPVLIRIETRSGHGGGMSTAKQIELLADQYAFLVRVLKMDAE